MAVFDLESFTQLADCWFPTTLNAGLSALNQSEIQAAKSWIDQYVFDAALVRRDKARNVTDALRDNIPANPDWNYTPLQPLFAKTGQDFDLARKLFGNMVCRVGINRPEQWQRFKQDRGGDFRSSTYVLSSSLPK